MPSLTELLEQSMVFVAARGAGFSPQQTESVEFPNPPAATTTVDDSTAETMAIWHWTADSTNLAKLDNLTCLTRGMANMRMLVCRNILFGDSDTTSQFITVKPFGHAALKLRLSSTFLARTFLSAGGSMGSGASKLFPLKAEVDRSLLRVYAYEFSAGPDADPVRSSEDTMAHADFMPDPAKTPTATGKPGERVTATVDVLRVVLFVSLVCCKERDDFDPGGALGGARFYPHMMVMANVGLEQVIGTVGYTRPPGSTMVNADGSESGMGMPDMNTPIGCGLFSDRNDSPTSLNVFGFNISPLPPPPMWDGIFDYYEMDPRGQTFVAVDPTTKARSIVGAVEALDLAIGDGSAKSYSPRTVRKVPGQAGFDNLHVAVTMKAFDNIKKALGYKGPPYSLEKIFMAPFCEHDCVHTHWRWGQSNTATQSLGWSGETPYAKAGAPLVPPNQTVRVRIISPFAFNYTAQADNANGPIAAGRWTIINHHGSAYAVSVGLLASLALSAVDKFVKLFNEPDIGDTSSEFSVFYWHLRFGGSASSISTPASDIVQERLRIKNLAAARDG
jgi:hypothetical protein